MFLEYGVNDHGELVRIDETGRGRLDGVYCPYCRRPLLARKGKVLAPHFAHDGETCRAADRDADVINLPVYDRFLLHLSPAELQALRVADGVQTRAAELLHMPRRTFVAKMREYALHAELDGR